MAAQVDLTKLYNASRHNRSALAKFVVCGCFYCFKEYPFEQIVQWTDDNETAVCPRCGVDAVLGFDTLNADADLLHKMHQKWFGRAKPLTQEEWQKALDENAWARSR